MKRDSFERTASTGPVRRGGVHRRWRLDDNSATGRHDERGAILILALAYIMVISVVVAALTTWASGDLNDTAKFNSARSLEYAASSVMQVGINSIRYTPLVGTGTGVQYTLNADPPSYCWGSGPTSSLQLPNLGVSFTVWCSTLEDLASTDTRTVTLSACQSTVSAAACATSPYLQAIVVFNDYPSGGSAQLTSPCTKYCGEGATLESWDWNSVAGLSDPIANTVTVTSTPPNIALVGQTYATASNATSGDTVVVTSATTSVCSVSGSGLVTFLANGTCTINFNDPGNANYAPAIQQQQTLTVGPLANAINITSAAPSGAVQGGTTYTPSATATSGDTVSITSTTSSICTIASGVVSFPGFGTCTLAFSDPGDLDYTAATTQDQSFSVAEWAPAGATLQTTTGSPNGVPSNGDTMEYTFNQLMSPGSIKSGWSGVSSTPVYVELSRTTGNSTTWQVCTSSVPCGTAINLGTVNLGDGTHGYYVGTFGSGSSGPAYFNATMVLSIVSGESEVSVTLGAQVSGTGTVTAQNPTTSTTTLTWTPSSSAQSTGGVACSTATVTESAGPKDNF